MEAAQAMQPDLPPDLDTHNSNSSDCPFACRDRTGVSLLQTRIAHAFLCVTALPAADERASEPAKNNPRNPRRQDRMTPDPIARWHRLVNERDAAGLDALLAEDAVFHSPVVHTPQVGKAVTQAYLAAALAVFGNDSFRYRRELHGEYDAVLEFELELDGIAINGVDMIRWNAEGRITEFKVMLRPLKAVTLIHEKMAAMLQAARR